MDDELNENQKTFALVWLENGFNATRAYSQAYPDVSVPTAASEGSRLLKNPKVQAFLAPYLERHWTRLQMSAEEALARIALDAAADLRELYDAETRALRHPADWPFELANSIESYKLKDDGSIEVKLVSKGAARRTILEIAGRIKSVAGSIDQLAEAIRKDVSRRTDVDVDNPTPS